MKRVAVEIKLNKAQETLLKRITDYIDNNDELPWESGIMRTNLQNAPYNPITKTKERIGKGTYIRSQHGNLK